MVGQVVTTVEVIGTSDTCDLVEIVECGTHFGVVFVASVPNHGYSVQERLASNKVFATIEAALEHAKARVESWGCRFPTDDDDPGYDESMDGDHGSALASAGLGTDEDYGGECYDYEGCCDD